MALDLKLRKLPCFLRRNVNRTVRVLENSLFMLYLLPARPSLSVPTFDVHVALAVSRGMSRTAEVALNRPFQTHGYPLKNKIAPKLILFHLFDR